MRVLLVDNSLSNCLVARSVLSRDGMVVRVATSGSEALALCRDTRFDAVLLDIVMPGLSGEETLAALLDANSEDPRPRPRHFALTAYDDAAETERYLSAGFDGVIGKPLRPGDLKRALSLCSDDAAPTLNMRSWSRVVATRRPLLDPTVIASGPGQADDATRALILMSYRASLTRTLEALSDTLPGRLAGSDKDTTGFYEALHTLRSISLTVGLDRAPNIASNVRSLPTETLVEGLAELLVAFRDSLPALDRALAVPDGLVAARQEGVVVKMRR
ncbi:MAG: response regulator [Litorimonas sp.]